MAINFILTNAGTINAVAGGKSFTIPRDHRNYTAIKAALKAGDEIEFARQADLAQTIQTFVAPVQPILGKVSVKDGQVFFDGKVLHNVITDRILNLIGEGFPFEPMLKFLENLMANPSYRAVTELYTFLEHKNLPITEDGHFLGYKSVRADYTDRHSGTVLNKIGTTVRVERNTVDDNWREACSSGLHVGSLEYVKSFHNYNDGGHVLLVKVNPADVVSVPPSEVTKLRTCAYEVVSEYDQELLRVGTGLAGDVYTADGTRAEPPTRPDDDDDSDDDDSDLDTDDDDSELDEDDDEDYDDDDSELDEDDEDDDLVDVVESLVLKLAKKLSQPFSRQTLYDDVKKGDSEVGAVNFNAEVQSAITRLIGTGKLVTTGTGALTVA